MLLCASVQEKGKEIGVYFESVPPGQTLLDLNLGSAEYFYVEVPGLGGHGVARCVSHDGFALGQRGGFILTLG